MPVRCKLTLQEHHMLTAKDLACRHVAPVVQGRVACGQGISDGGQGSSASYIIPG